VPKTLLNSPSHITGKKACLGAGDLDEAVVVIRVARADLSRSFDHFGRMDPFAVVEQVGEDGTAREISRTGTDWGAHMNPIWDHTCRGVLYGSSNSGDKLRFRVLEKNFGDLGKPTFCGEACVDISTLVEGINAGKRTWGAPQLETLWKNGEATGTLTLQAGINVESCSLTSVDAALFEEPAKRIGVSGGTAPFFHLNLRDVGAGSSRDRWIGKDLSRAADEITFYEQMRKLSQQLGSGFEPLLEFMIDYKGVAECAVESESKSASRKQLLVMQNLRAGYDSFRMLDIKIGQKTADAGWQGKSRFAALRQSIVDGLTTSQSQGFRLEGFDGQPPALLSADPLLDLRRDGGESIRKKAFRVMLQRMTAPEMFMHFLDVHQSPADPGDSEVATVLSPTEVAEQGLGEMVCQLACLAIACRKAPAPQKWLGSSVALCFDAGTLPSRKGFAGKHSEAARVKIFDWGRSELNTPEHHASLPPEERRDRANFWRNYVGGVDRLAWEAARAYWHRFGNTAEWSEVHVAVTDFDSMSPDEFIGMVSLRLAEGEATVPLVDKKGAPVKGRGGQPSTLTYSMAFRKFPEGARLRGVWRISILRAANLPACDPLQSTSDPFVSLTALSADKLRGFQQQSAVIQRDLNPQWDETFELPLARGGLLEETLELAAHGLSGAPDGGAAPAMQPLSAFFPLLKEGASSPAVEQALKLWTARLAECAHRPSIEKKRDVTTAPVQIQPTAEKPVEISIVDATLDRSTGGAGGWCFCQQRCA